MVVLTAKLGGGAAWTLPAASGGGADLHRSVYLYAGGRASFDGKTVSDRQRVKVKAGADVRIENGSADEPLERLLQGRDIGEPVVQHGPFVGNTRQDIMKAFEDYQRTGFGGWPGRRRRTRSVATSRGLRSTATARSTSGRCSARRERASFPVWVFIADYPCTSPLTAHASCHAERGGDARAPRPSRWRR